MGKCLDSVRLQFHRDYNYCRGHMSRSVGLLIIMNTSLFFLTELVTRQHCFYTYFSLAFLGIVEFGLLVPIGLQRRLGCYLFFSGV